VRAVVLINSAINAITDSRGMLQRCNALIIALLINIGMELDVLIAL